MSRRMGAVEPVAVGATAAAAWGLLRWLLIHPPVAARTLSGARIMSTRVIRSSRKVSTMTESTAHRVVEADTVRRVAVAGGELHDGLGEPRADVEVAA